MAFKLFFSLCRCKAKSASSKIGIKVTALSFENNPRRKAAAVVNLEPFRYNKKPLRQKKVANISVRPETQATDSQVSGCKVKRRAPLKAGTLLS